MTPKFYECTQWLLGGMTAGCGIATVVLYAKDHPNIPWWLMGLAVAAVVALCLALTSWMARSGAKSLSEAGEQEELRRKRIEQWETDHES